ncbi:hypothetical protein BJ741DRAFT_87628 [Chytriomyces cf. hyalinus JEL632]|nr:hypothetical protein BJ741DRAFT_87628 [Chytriomyces cf. hyalinus JEL632]
MLATQRALRIILFVFSFKQYGDVERLVRVVDSLKGLQDYEFRMMPNHLSAYPDPYPQSVIIPFLPKLFVLCFNVATSAPEVAQHLLDKHTLDDESNVGSILADNQNKMEVSRERKTVRFGEVTAVVATVSPPSDDTPELCQESDESVARESLESDSMNDFATYMESTLSVLQVSAPAIEFGARYDSLLRIGDKLGQRDVSRVKMGVKRNGPIRIRLADPSKASETLFPNNSRMHVSRHPPPPPLEMSTCQRVSRQRSSSTGHTELAAFDMRR